MQQPDKMSPVEPWMHAIDGQYFHHWLQGNERAAEILDDFERLFGEAVATSRKARGWSQRQLADAVRGIAPESSLDSSAITRIEAGKRTVSFKQAVTIAAALDQESAEGMVMETVAGGPTLSMLDWAVQVRERVAELEAEAARAEAEHAFKQQQLEGHRQQLEGVLAGLLDEEREQYARRTGDV